ncbi:hypothetical protein CDAR_294821 [Caerostris darwini]|uniref:Uncharacterized protein n=1 Tax=Caerostris darwini TaxID=1538125 RepID=A0AAV4UKM1_9ARAC|nr:hypothetical protein CDAR_294821 [Caerostris darwini]
MDASSDVTRTPCESFAKTGARLGSGEGGMSADRCRKIDEQPQTLQINRNPILDPPTPPSVFPFSPEIAGRMRAQADRWRSAGNERPAKGGQPRRQGTWSTCTLSHME